MHPSLAVFFAMLAATAATSLGQIGGVLIDSRPGNIIVANQNGQQVNIATNQQGALKEVNGLQTIVVEISGPGRIPKVVELPDQVGPSGISQSDILQQIFSQATGVQNEITFQIILDTVAAKVAKGKVNPAVLAALETISPRNQQIHTAANQILTQTEQKQLEKQAVADALTQKLGGLGLGGLNVVVEVGIEDILIANGKGQQVNIATKQQSRLGGPQTLQIQVTGPGVVPRTYSVVDQQVGLSQSDILQQIAQQNRGLQTAQTYQIFLNEVSAAVSGGQVNPAVLATLEALAPQNQGNPIVVNQLLDQAQQIASVQNGLQSRLEGQSFYLKSEGLGLGSQAFGLGGRGSGLGQLAHLQGKVVVEAGLGQVVVVNQQGQQVRIVANQKTGGLFSPQIIVIQLTGASGLSKVIQIVDQQVAPGVLESDVLQQIAQQFSGSQTAQSYQVLLSTIAAKVADGQLNPAILLALEAVSPQNQLSAQKVIQRQGPFGGLWSLGVGSQSGVGSILPQQGTLQSLRLSQVLGSSGLTPAISPQGGFPFGLGWQNDNLVGTQERIINQLPLPAVPV